MQNRFQSLLRSVSAPLAKLRSIPQPLAVVAAVALGWPAGAAFSSAQAAGVAFQTEDVLAGVGNGTIKHFRSDNTGRMVLVDVLNTGAGGTEDTGMAFDAAGNLYATVFEANNLYKFDNKGNLIGRFGGGYNRDPESIVFDRTGNMYVGQADGSGQVLKFSPLGALIDTYSPQREDRGTDWIDLAADQCTLHYTSEGSSIKSFDICSKTQLPDFATGLNAPCYAHRIRPNAEELVACTKLIYRLDSSGRAIQTYQLPGTSLLFALNLDPDNKTFWTADYFNGLVFRIDIATGMIVTQFNAGVLRSLAGLAVVGEIAAATTAPPSTTSYYVKTSKSQTLRDAGRALALAQIAAGINQDSVVALLFRSPTLKNGQYGVAGLGGSTPLSTVATLVEDFASGYYNALGNNNTLHVRLVIATSNGTTQCGGNQVTSAHGRAWAQMVQTVASWVISSGYSGQVDIAGGSDMEASASVWPSTASCGAAGSRQWASATDTRAWVDGYSSVMPRRFLYNVGDAGGCPQSGTTAVAGSCAGGWTQEDVWYVSWGAPPSEPLPEIYTTNGSMAAQWANLSLYGYLAHGAPVIMAGALTESEACDQVGCPDTLENTPAAGWLELYNKLELNSGTAQTLSWSTDIAWLN